jgi:hypothetical protein
MTRWADLTPEERAQVVEFLREQVTLSENTLRRLVKLTYGPRHKIVEHSLRRAQALLSLVPEEDA